MSILEGQVYESQTPYRFFHSGLNEIWLQNEKLSERVQNGCQIQDGRQKQDGRQINKNTNDTCFKVFLGSRNQIKMLVW